MSKLSAVIITLNEEKNIARCLDSIKHVADDIVVIDSFSTDNTSLICKQKNVRFIQHVFEGYIEQKNFAVSYTKYQHVLSLDADEALSDELIESIIKIKNHLDLDGYHMNRLTNYCGKWIRHCGWYPDKKLRLFNKNKGGWTGTNPHDKFELYHKSKIGFLKGNILHYSYYSIQDHIKQVNNFTSISSQALYKQGKKVSIFKLLMTPFFRFIRDYFIKLGFLDGYYGFVICKISSQASFLKYSKLRQLHKALK